MTALKIADWFAYALAGLLVITFFGGYTIMALNNDAGIYINILSEMTTTVRDCIILIVGYYWGSSKGSTEKNYLLTSRQP